MELQKIWIKLKMRRTFRVSIHEIEECMKLLTNWLYQWKMMRCNTWAKWDHMDEIWSHGMIWLCGCNLMTLLKLCHQLDYVVELDGIHEISHEDEIQNLCGWNWTIQLNIIHMNAREWNWWHPWTQFFFSWIKERTTKCTQPYGWNMKTTMKPCLLVMGKYWSSLHPLL
jgi:hypothetical protein